MTNWVISGSLVPGNKLPDDARQSSFFLSTGLNQYLCPVSAEGRVEHEKLKQVAEQLVFGVQLAYS